MAGFSTPQSRFASAHRSKNRCPYIRAKAEDHKVINVAIGEKYQVINQRDI